MKIERKSFVRFAVAVALACYDRPIDQEITAEEAAVLLKWVIDMALGPNAADVTVEPMKNYPVSSKMPICSPKCSVRSPSPVTVSLRDRRS